MFPEKIATSDVTGMVFLVDDFFNPIYAEKDVLVSFTSENAILPQQIKIPAESSHAFFVASILGDAHITAYTDSSVSDTVDIDFGVAEKGVHIGIAPDIIAPYSFAYLFAWIEENGIPLEPVLPIKSTLHVSNNDVLGIDGPFDTSDTVYLRDGFLMKKLTTNNPGQSSVTVNVPGYGTASKTVSVGTPFDPNKDLLAKSLEDGCDVSKIGAGYTGCDSGGIHYTSQEQYVRESLIAPAEISNGTIRESQIISEEIPDGITITANVFPSVTSGDAYLVWSLYDVMNSTMHPTYGDKGDKFYITSQNLIHDSVISFETEQRKTQSQIIPISGSIIGNHAISVSSDIISGSVTSEMNIASPIQYGLSVVSLPPVNAPDTRPLFAVSVLDSDGYAVDPHLVFGGLGVTLLSDDAVFAKKSIFLDDTMSIIYGTSDVLYPSITILANEQNIVTSTSYRPASDHSIDIQMPKRVHSGEEFPAYAFLVNSEGKPVSDIREYIQSKCTDNNELFSCQIDSEFVVFEGGIGFMSETISVFENQFSLEDISIDLGGVNEDNSIGVGSTVIVYYDIPPGSVIDVATSIPHTIGSDSITLEPDYTGKHDVYFTVSQPGFENYNLDVSYLVDDSIHLNVKTVTTNGVAIPSIVSISNNDETVSVSAPGEVDIHRGNMHFEFVPSIILDSAGYSFDHVLINSITYASPIIDVHLMSPSEISATYDRVVNIVVSNANGGGVYDYGQLVTISAPPHNIVGPLIRDVFDHWDHLPAGYDVYSDVVTITATESFTTSAVYRDDFSGLILTVMGMILGMFAILKRGRLISIVRTYAVRK